MDAKRYDDAVLKIIAESENWAAMCRADPELLNYNGSVKLCLIDLDRINCGANTKVFALETKSAQYFFTVDLTARKVIRYSVAATKQ